VSLVLDALKKLERDKQTAEPGVLVVGAVPWQGVRRRRAPLGALASVALLLLAVGSFAWWLGRSPRVVTPEAGAPVRTAVPAAPSGPPIPLAAAAAPPVRRLTLPAPATPAPPAAGPAEVAPPSRGGPQLNAISRQDGRPVAVIDGRLVREGDSLDGVRVLHIGETEVEIEVRGVRRTLRF
jgi:hypothetical protein